MKKFLYAFVAAAGLISCGGATKQTTMQETAMEDSTVSAVTLIALGRMGDPICEMPYDTSYAEYSVYKGHTVHFCSPTCKSVFDKNPEKYAANLK
jgi:YHS domain-containing protein